MTIEDLINALALIAIVFVLMTISFVIGYDYGYFKGAQEEIIKRIKRNPINITLEKWRKK